MSHVVCTVDVVALFCSSHHGSYLGAFVSHHQWMKLNECMGVNLWMIERNIRVFMRSAGESLHGRKVSEKCLILS